jgi:hypothetical protein
MICGECNFLNNCPAAHSGIKMAHDDPACDIGIALVESEASGFAMAAGQCDVKGGLLSDDYGHTYCSLEKENERLKTFGALLPAGVAEVMTDDYGHTHDDTANTSDEMGEVKRLREALGKT